MIKLYFSIPSHLIELFVQVKRELELKSYVVTNDFDEQGRNNYSGVDVSLVNNQVSSSDIVLAVDVKRPAVLFELGVAAGMSKKIIIMARDEEEIPHFLEDFFYLRWRDSMFVAEIIDQFIKTQFKDVFKPKVETEFATLRDLMIASAESPSVLDNVSPKDFEILVFNYFDSKGYGPTNWEDGQKGYGYDFILEHYKEHQKTLVEVKKNNSNQRLSIPPIQQLLGAMMAYKADHSIIVTSSGFTTSALSFSAKLEKLKVELWDLQKLKMEIFDIKF